MNDLCKKFYISYIVLAVTGFILIMFCECFSVSRPNFVSPFAPAWHRYLLTSFEVLGMVLIGLGIGLGYIYATDAEKRSYVKPIWISTIIGFILSILMIFISIKYPAFLLVCMFIAVASLTTPLGIIIGKLIVDKAKGH